MEKGLLVIVIFITFLVGMAIGTHIESSDVSLTYNGNSLLVSDVMFDNVHIFKTSDTTYTILHPKLKVNKD